MNQNEKQSKIQFCLWISRISDTTYLT